MKKLSFICICSLLALSAGASVRRVADGGDLLRAIRTLGANDTLVVAAGDYAVKSVLPVKGNTVIVGEPGARPHITLSAFRLGVGARQLVLCNLALTLTGRSVVETPSEGGLDIDLVAFEECSVDLGGATGGGLVNSRTPGTERNRIGEIRVADCLVFNGGYPQHFVYAAGSASQTSVGKIVLSGSTFADMARGAVVTNAPMKTDIDIDRCTFYDINRSDNSAGTIRLSNARVRVHVTHSLFTFAGPASRFIVAGPGSEVTVEESYMTGELASISGARGLKRLAERASEAFEAPAHNPLAEGASLRLREKVAPGEEIGDPRWN